MNLWSNASRANPIIEIEQSAATHFAKKEELKGQREYHQNQPQSRGIDTNGICLLGEASYSRSKNHYKSYSHAQEPAITCSHGTFAASMAFNQVRQPTTSFVTPSRYPYHYNKGHEGRFDTCLLQLPSPTAKNYRHKLAMRESIHQSSIKPGPNIVLPNPDQIFFSGIKRQKPTIETESGAGQRSSLESFGSGVMALRAASYVQSATRAFYSSMRIVSGGQAKLSKEKNHGYCLMCETDCNSIHGHGKTWHTERSYQVQYLSPDERILHYKFTNINELKKCPSCDRFFYKHRCYRHGCDFPRSSAEMEAAPELNAGEADSQEKKKQGGRCLMCRFHFDDLFHHRKLWHLGNEKYHVRQVYGETVLLPEETVNKNLRKCYFCRKVTYRYEIEKKHFCAML